MSWKSSHSCNKAATNCLMMVAGVMMRVNSLYSGEVNLMDTVSLSPLSSVAGSPSEGDPYLNITSRFGLCDFK